MGLFSKTSTYDPMSAYTPQQRAAVQMLMDLAATGSGGGLTLGEQYTGDLGAYDLTGQTQSGLSALQQLLTGSTSPTSDIGKARTTFTNLADTTFDPSDPKTGYAAFSRALAKAGQESSDVIDREAAITGNRFGTAILGEKADLAENLQLQRQQALANLYQGSQAMQLAGAQGLTGLADQIAQLSGLNITYGDMQRQIKDQQAKDQLNEFARAREEELSRIGLAQDQMQNPLGTISTKSPTALAGLVNTALMVGGYALGGPLGGMIGSGIGSAVTGTGGSSTGGFSLSGLSGLFGGTTSKSSYNSTIPSYKNSGFSLLGSV